MTKPLLTQPTQEQADEYQRLRSRGVPIAEAAKVIGVAVSVVYRWMREGKQLEHEMRDHEKRTQKARRNVSLCETGQTPEPSDELDVMYTLVELYGEDEVINHFEGHQ